MLNTGFTSGCFEVISNDNEKIYASILEKIKPLAQDEWSNSINCSTKTFSAFYKLTKEEKMAFTNKKDMPDSFVAKFYDAHVENSTYGLLTHIPHFYLDKRINPSVEDLKNHLIYGVKCNVCGKTYIIDQYSLCIKKRRSCCGGDCLSNSVTQEENYAESLCVIDNSTSIQKLDSQLMSVENISNPLSFYGGTKDIKIAYISDMHLLHHTSDEITANELVKRIVPDLYQSIDEADLIVFAGDTSSDAQLTIEFYRAFVHYYDFIRFKEAKSDLIYYQNQINTLKNDIDNLERHVIRMTSSVEKIKAEIANYIDFNEVAKYKSRYYEGNRWEDAIKAFRSTKSYINNNVSNECDALLEYIAPKLDILEKIIKDHGHFIEKYKNCIRDIKNIEAKHKKKLDSLTISDIYKKHHLLTEIVPIVAVLGNHEYVEFASVKEGRQYYSQELKKMGIKLLHNNHFLCSVSIDDDSNKIGSLVIFGGTGFAKYNEKYNADSLICCQGFTRKQEIRETDLFEKAYTKAKTVADTKKLPLICVSHYPVNDCLSNKSKDVIYFYGHNHQNYYHRNENETIYADNQIGYSNPHFGFKTICTGYERNPYCDLQDGMYKTTIKDYLQFYKYIGEGIGDGSLLYQRCQNNKATLYVIKRKGYYGFFIVNVNSGSSRGISIVDGGKTKRITKSTDLQWLFNNFEIVLSKYLEALLPLRAAQEGISKELKELGLSGNIHGCIVDIDYFHHIMLNPIDGTVTYYYSPFFGLVTPLSSFENVLKSIKDNNSWQIDKYTDIRLVEKKYKAIQGSNTSVLSTIGSISLLEDTNNVLTEAENKEYMVSRSEGMYGLSRKVSPLQRLFSGHVLRTFDLNLADTMPEITKKK